MPRGSIYRSEFLNDLDETLQLDVTIASNSFLTAPPIVVVGVNVYEGTDFVILAKFKDMVIGTPETTNPTVKTNLRRLTGSTDLTDYRSYLLAPRADANSTLVLWTDGISSITKTYRTFNRWVLRNLTTGKILFDGVQVPERETPIVLAADRAILEVQLVDSLRWITEQLTSADLNDGMISTMAAATPQRYLYKFAHRGSTSGIHTMHVYGDHPLVTNYRRFHLVTLSSIVSRIMALLSEIYQALTRNEDAGITFSHSASITSPHPYAHWTLYEWTHDGTGAPGVAVTEPDPHMIGWITFNDEPNTVVGGLFSADKKASWGAVWPTVWDWLGKISENAVNKTLGNVFEFGGAPFIEIAAYRLNEALSSGAQAFDITELAEEIVPVRGFGVIARARASFAGAISDDQSTIEYEARVVSEKEDGWPLPDGFHNATATWPDGERSYNAYSISGGTFDTEPHMALHTPHAPVFGFFYPAFVSGVVEVASGAFFSYHPHCKIDMGGGVSYETSADDLTLPDVWNADINGDFALGETLLGTPTRIEYLERQLNTGMPYLAARAVATTFSRLTQTEYPLEYPKAGAPTPNALGNRFDSTDFPDGSIFINGETWLGDMPGEPDIVELEYNVVATTAKGRAIGRGTT